MSQRQVWTNTQSKLNFFAQMAHGQPLMAYCGWAITDVLVAEMAKMAEMGRDGWDHADMA